MSSSGPEEHGWGAAANHANAEILSEHQLTLDKLNSPSGQAKPYNIFSPARRPELKSDLKSSAPESFRGSNNTTWSSVSSFFSRTQSGTSSAATSPANSKDFDDKFRRPQVPPPPTISRFSTATLESEQPTVQLPLESPDHFVAKGAVYTLVKEAAKAGTLRGAVDIHGQKILHDKFSEKIWDMIEYPESQVELQRQKKLQAILPPEPAYNLLKKALETPASKQQDTSETPRLELPDIVPPSPKSSRSRSTSALSSTQNFDPNGPRISWASTSGSFHTARSRSHDHSVTSSPSAHHTVLTTHGTPAAMQPISSIDSRVELEIEKIEAITPAPKEGDEASDILGSLPHPKTSNVGAVSIKLQGLRNTALSQVSAEDSCAVRNEVFRRDVRILHPKTTASIVTFALFDSQSNHSHISPRALERLGISLKDDEVIRPSTYKYSTNDGPVVTTGGEITLDWRIFGDPGAPSLHELNTFYISSDKAPYDGILLGTDFLLPEGGEPRMNLCLINVADPETPQTEEEKRKAKEAAEERARRNEELKKAARASSQTKRKY